MQLRHYYPRAWNVIVQVPDTLTDEQKDSLFQAIAEVAHEWEPEDRDGWDVDVSTGGGPLIGR